MIGTIDKELAQWLHERAHLIEALAKGEPLQFVDPRGEWCFSNRLSLVNKPTCYRVRPKPTTIVHWDMFGPIFNFAATTHKGDVLLFKDKPTEWGNPKKQWIYDGAGYIIKRDMYKVAVPAECAWEDSLVSRPGAEG